MNLDRRVAWTGLVAAAAVGICMAGGSASWAGKVKDAPAAVADKSLPDGSYVALGVPAYDHAWMSRDLAVAAEKLQALAAQHPEQLPRFGSGKSGKTFARIAAPADKQFFETRSLALGVRMSEAMAFLSASNSVLKVYIGGFTAGQIAGSDLIELLGSQLRTSLVVLELVDELVPTFSKNDPKYQTRMAGLDKIRNGLAQIVSGAITSFSEAQVYSVDDRRKLAEYCRETFPALVPRLTPASQAEVRQRLGQLVSGAPPRELRPQLVALRDAVMTATNP